MLVLPAWWPTWARADPARPLPDRTCQQHPGSDLREHRRPLPQPHHLAQLHHRESEQALVLVETASYLVPCLSDCGPYSQCLLLRRHSYLYVGCSCKPVQPRLHQPGEVVLCMLSCDTLQCCDFLGSGVSIWVTILRMAQLKAALK
ncbi:Post-GPI attachment to proteins factor 6 [Manis javanica]|nr:Post-GPI attachment to proteins factor 6 [Manis javanica]